MWGYECRRFNYNTFVVPKKTKEELYMSYLKVSFGITAIVVGHARCAQNRWMAAASALLLS